VIAFVCGLVGFACIAFGLSVKSVGCALIGAFALGVAFAHVIDDRQLRRRSWLLRWPIVLAYLCCTYQDEVLGRQWLTTLRVGPVLFSYRPALAVQWLRPEERRP
jgi:hypothetical protein